MIERTKAVGEDEKQFYYTILDVAQAAGVGEKKVLDAIKNGDLIMDCFGSVIIWIGGRMLEWEKKVMEEGIK